MSKGEFKAQVWTDLLKKIVADPPSDRMLDTVLLDQICLFVKSGEADPIAVWNFYKRLLDAMVYGAAAAPFFITLFDLERSYVGPAGSYQHDDGSIGRAPWRLDRSLLVTRP